jgi:hypothetical protein
VLVLRDVPAQIVVLFLQRRDIDVLLAAHEVLQLFQLVQRAGQLAALRA